MPITQPMAIPVTVSGAHAAALRAIADAAADLAAAVRNLLDDQAETTTDPTPTAPHGLASPTAPTVALPIGQLVDLDALGLGAVIRADVFGSRDALLIKVDHSGELPWILEGIDLRAGVGQHISNVKVLHPGITLVGEGQLAGHEHEPAHACRACRAEAIAQPDETCEVPNPETPAESEVPTP